MQIFFYRDYELQKFFFWAVLKRVPFLNVLEKIGPKGNLLFLFSMQLPGQILVPIQSLIERFIACDERSKL